jgi:hypothetical protein
MPHQTIPIAELDRQAEASGMPEVWAEIVCVAHRLARLERDVARVRLDLDRCPPTAYGRALARQLWADTQRREGEITKAKSHLDRLRRDVGAGFVEAAAAEAPARRGLWVVLPGGSEGDG